jgi:hypothetical protein
VAVTVNQFIVRFAEFCDADKDLVQACIDDAELMIDRSWYGDKADMAVRYKAAHLLAINPLGEMARLEKDKHSTTYGKIFSKIKGSIGAGCRVI